MQVINLSKLVSASSLTESAEATRQGNIISILTMITMVSLFHDFLTFDYISKLNMLTFLALPTCNGSDSTAQYLMHNIP